MSVSERHLILGRIELAMANAKLLDTSVAEMEPTAFAQQLSEHVLRTLSQVHVSLLHGMEAATELQHLEQNAQQPAALAAGSTAMQRCTTRARPASTT